MSGFACGLTRKRNHSSDPLFFAALLRTPDAAANTIDDKRRLSHYDLISLLFFSYNKDKFLKVSGFCCGKDRNGIIHRILFASPLRIPDAAKQSMTTTPSFSHLIYFFTIFLMQQGPPPSVEQAAAAVAAAKAAAAAAAVVGGNENLQNNRFIPGKNIS